MSLRQRLYPSRLLNRARPQAQACWAEGLPRLKLWVHVGELPSRVFLLTPQESPVHAPPWLAPPGTSPSQASPCVLPVLPWLSQLT